MAGRPDRPVVVAGGTPWQPESWHSPLLIWEEQHPRDSPSSTSPCTCLALPSPGITPPPAPASRSWALKSGLAGPPGKGRGAGSFLTAPHPGTKADGSLLCTPSLLRQAFCPGDHPFLSSLHVARMAHRPGQSTAPGHTVMQRGCWSQTGPGAFLGLAETLGKRGCLVTSHHPRRPSMEGPGWWQVRELGRVEGRRGAFSFLCGGGGGGVGEPRWLLEVKGAGSQPQELPPGQR